MMVFSRRQALLLGLAVPLLPLESGCRASLPGAAPDSGAAALALLKMSAEAHGLSSYAAIRDLNVSYAGHWRRLVGKLQPALVDAGFRGGSEERLLLPEGMTAQSHTGPKGHKQVVRINPPQGAGTIQVWYNGVPALDRERLDAAALVADAYALFLLGPMLLMVNEHPRRDIDAACAGTAELVQDKQKFQCDVLHFKVSPGFGNAESDQLALYIDRDHHLMRRVRMTLNGLESTRGALVDIDTSEHRSLHGLVWPTAFHERLLRPAPLDVHHWLLVGLDINRGETRGQIEGPAFVGDAVAPAAPF